MSSASFVTVFVNCHLRPCHFLISMALVRLSSCCLLPFVPCYYCPDVPRKSFLALIKYILYLFFLLYLYLEQTHFVFVFLIVFVFVTFRAAVSVLPLSSLFCPQCLSPTIAQTGQGSNTFYHFGQNVFVQKENVFVPMARCICLFCLSLYWSAGPSVPKEIWSRVSPQP